MQKVAKLAKGFQKKAKKEKDNKEKEKETQPVKQPPPDDVFAVSVKPKGNKDKPGTKEKKKGKKGRGASGGGSSRFSSDDNLSQYGSVADFNGSGPTSKDKSKKRPKSKGCEEAVNKAVADFWESAWHVCADRFFVTSAPIVVSLELRNTWLRIVEAEWQDPDMREHVTTRPNRIFLKDESPLPLAFDSWSRGAMEILPKCRRESVLDPFLRDMDYFAKLKEIEEESQEEVASYTTAPSGVSNLHSEKKEGSTRSTQTKAQSDVMPKSSEAPKEPSSPPYDHWDFDLDKQAASSTNPMMELLKEQKEQDTRSSIKSDGQLDSSSTPTETASITGKASAESDDYEELSSGKAWTLLMPSRALNEDSTTDFDVPTLIGGKPRRSPFIKFSPSQCGGATGSGIFRLPDETTSEALVKMQHKNGSDKRIIGPHVASLIDHETEKRQSLYAPRECGGDRNDRFAECVVEPLFDERSSKPPEEGDRNSFEMDTKFRSSIGIVADFHFDSIFSVKEKKFLKRKVANLQNRFKRQTMRFLANKALIKKSTEVPAPVDSDENIPPLGPQTDSNASIENGPKVVKSSYSEPLINKNIRSQGNVQAVDTFGVNRPGGKVFGFVMKKRPSLMKIPPNIETYRRVSRVPCNEDKPPQIRPNQTSDTCLYTRPSVVRDDDRDCYPKNDFEQQQCRILEDKRRRCDEMRILTPLKPIVFPK